MFPHYYNIYHNYNYDNNIELLCLLIFNNSYDTNIFFLFNNNIIKITMNLSSNIILFSLVKKLENILVDVIQQKNV